MGQYTITHPDGRTMTVEGEREPTQEEATALWAQYETTHPGAPPVAETPPEPYDAGPALDRFIAGAARTGLPSVETIGEFAGAAGDMPLPGRMFDIGEDGKLHLRGQKGVKLVLDTLKGAAQAHKEQFVKAYDAAQGVTTDPDMPMAERGKKGISSIAHLIAGLTPLVGPAAADAGEKIYSGDIAGGLGEFTGLGAGLVPLGTTARSALRTGASNMAARGAGKSLAKVLEARPTDIPTILSNAPALIDQLGIGSRNTILDRIKGTGAIERSTTAPHDPLSLLGRAETALENVKVAGRNIPIPIQEAADALRATIDEIRTPPNAPEPAPRSFDMEKVRAIEKEIAELERLGRAYGTAGTPGTPAIPPSQDLMGNQIPGVPAVPGTPGTMGRPPASEVFKARTQSGQRGKRGQGFKDNPLGTRTPEAEAGAATHTQIGVLLKRLVPGLVDTDLNYNTLRQAGDLIEAATRKEVRKPSAALEVMALRTGMKAGAAGLLGNLTPIGFMGGATAYGMFKVAAEITNSAWFQSLSAQQKLALARALQSGVMDTAEIAARVGASGLPAASRAKEENAKVK